MAVKAHAAWMFTWMVLAGPVAAMEPHAFLNKPAKSTDQLISQVKSDPIVADRYVRHFAMTKKEVTAYFRTLKPTTLTADGSYDVYNVLPNGKIRVRTFALKRGTSVFKDPAGMAVLKRSCGNPMTWNVATHPSPVNAGPVDVPTVSVDQQIVQAELPPTTPQLMTPLPDFNPPKAVAMMPSVPDFTIGQLPETGKEAVAPLPIIAAAPNLGFLSVLIVPFIIPPGGHDTPPVPEPSSVAAVVAGLSALGWQLRRRG